MSDLQTQLNAIASNYRIVGAVPLAVGAVVLLDEKGNIVIDSRDLPGTLARLLASTTGILQAPNNVMDLQGTDDPTNTESATLSTNLTGTNNDLVFTAVAIGTAGNDVTVQYIDPGAINIPLSIALVGNAIKITLATDGDGVITTIADDITADKAGFESLATVADKAANDGTGVVTALAATHLAGGEDATSGGTAGPGSRYTNYTDGTLWINTGTKAAPVWAELVPA